MKVVAVIPARFASKRFPGKPLALILGKPMVQWVWERAVRVRGVGRVIVATEDKRVAAAVRAFGGEVVLTSEDCPSGSDRAWEAARNMDFDVLVNLQGDEPALDPSAVESLLALMGFPIGAPADENREVDMGTLVTPIAGQAEFEDPNVVKVAMGANGRCLYFSRSPIPFQREKGIVDARAWRHIGVYAFRKDFLRRFVSWRVGELEAAESLEQLRALERGAAVVAARVKWRACSVDVPGDIARAEAVLSSEGSGKSDEG